MLIAAIGGATGSGKTTLAKHLGRIIPSLLVFEDDFAPPEDEVPNDEDEQLHGRLLDDASSRRFSTFAGLTRCCSLLRILSSFGSRDCLPTSTCNGDTFDNLLKLYDG